MRRYVSLLVKEERGELLTICRSTTIMGPLLLIKEQNEYGSVDKGELLQRVEHIRHSSDPNH
jgi:hypothetical protein